MDAAALERGAVVTSQEEQHTTPTTTGSLGTVDGTFSLMTQIGSTTSGMARGLAAPGLDRSFTQHKKIMLLNQWITAVRRIARAIVTAK